MPAQRAYGNAGRRLFIASSPPSIGRQFQPRSTGADDGVFAAYYILGHSHDAAVMPRFSAEQGLTAG